MPKIPDPETLLEIARSTQRTIDDREWKQYQRYLAKHDQQPANPLNEEPLSFEDFCARLRKNEIYRQEQEIDLNNE